MIALTICTYNFNTLGRMVRQIGVLFQKRSVLRCQGKQEVNKRQCESFGLPL